MVRIEAWETKIEPAVDVEFATCHWQSQWFELDICTTWQVRRLNPTQEHLCSCTAGLFTEINEYTGPLVGYRG